MQKVRENFLIASVICITAGGFFSVANLMSLAATIGIEWCGTFCSWNEYEIRTGLIARGNPELDSGIYAITRCRESDVSCRRNIG